MTKKARKKMVMRMRKAFKARIQAKKKLHRADATYKKLARKFKAA